MKQIHYLLVIILSLLILAIVAVFIQQGSEAIANLAKHTNELFKKADLRPSDNGFNAFIQLIFISVFVGWVIHRFKRK